jgi:hypothetical protein
MTSETAPSGNVYKSSQSGGNNAWQCFDKNIATYWESLASSLPTWIAYKFTSAKILSRYTVTVRSVAARAPKTFKLQGSNDSTNGADGTWEDLDTRLDENTWGSGEKRTYDFVNATAYSMYRLYITANNGDTYMEITEIELMNAPATQADIVSIRALNLADNVDQIMLFAEVTVGSGTAGYYVSTDDGISWAEVELDKLVSVPAGQQLRIKVELTGDAELDYWGIAA